MSTSLNKRLEQIEPRITSEAFLASEGIGNEIACYIFDYAASEELEVRSHLDWLKKRFTSHHRHLRVLHLDLLDVITAYLEERKLLQKALEMQATKGSTAVLKALRGPVTGEKLRDFIASRYKPEDYNLVLLSGVGSAWPMLRAHNLLNCLHTVMDQTPLVMFYPGTFDGTTLRLFGQIDPSETMPGTKPYYRAFILIPRETQS